MTDQVAEYIEVRGETRSREIAKVVKEYFSKFSLERKKIVEKEPKGSMGTRRVKIVLCHVNRKTDGGRGQH